jgi:hypothetical protein
MDFDAVVDRGIHSVYDQVIVEADECEMHGKDRSKAGL